MEGENWVDDGNETFFQKRLTEFMRLRWLNKLEKKKENGEGTFLFLFYFIIVKKNI
jgi:hypothetical protein